MNSKSTSRYFHALRDAALRNNWHGWNFYARNRKTYAAAWRWNGARKQHGAVKNLRYKKGGQR